jgi:hypothetical protein
VGVVTLSESSLISAIERQAKWFKSHTSAFAVIGEFRSIWLDVTTPVPARLHQNVQDLAFTINGAPQVHVFAVDRNEDLIQMPPDIGS